MPSTCWNTRACRGPLVKGITSSIMLNKLADKYGVEVHDMPVGFKPHWPQVQRG